MNGSPSAILSLGIGAWGSPSLMVTLGYGTSLPFTKYPGSGTFAYAGLTAEFSMSGLSGTFEHAGPTGEFERRQ